MNKSRLGRPVAVGVIGVGWIGRLRAVASARHSSVSRLLLADIDEARLQSVAAETGADAATEDFRDWIDEADVVFIATTPEATHYSIAKECLAAGKPVLLEKPISLTLDEADELVGLAKVQGVNFAVGYTQRFNPKLAYVKKAIEEGAVGRPVTSLISRNMTRSIGQKVTGRVKMGPALMQATHDVDLELWWLEGDRPVCVYAQSSRGVLFEASGVPDCTWMIVTMESGVTFTVGANWNLPPETKGSQFAVIEFIGTEGAVFVDDGHRDVLISSTRSGLNRGMASMPGEQVGHLFAGPMDVETTHFIDSVVRGEPTLATGEQARAVLEVCLAAESSAASGQPVRLARRVNADQDTSSTQQASLPVAGREA